MVARLVAAGDDVRVLGRSGEKRSAIAELGAEPVDDIAAVGAAADVVVVCVFAPATRPVSGRISQFR